MVLGKEQLPEPKPSPSGLLEACNLLKVGHDDVIYVGDNVTDIVCAKNMAAYSVGLVTTKDSWNNKNRHILVNRSQIFEN